MKNNISVCVVGLGYVGLPLLESFSKHFKVIGFDINKNKINRLRKNFNFELTSTYVEYLIEDDGKGFDYNGLPDPRDPENFLRDSGRGLLIITIHMDEVEWNNKGNCIRLRKYRVDKV